jgi:RNA polymerase sigma factor (sigma-70 family)
MPGRDGASRTRYGPGVLPSVDALADLLAATGRGDRAAFRALYERTAAKLLGVTLRILRDRASAEDVLQDVYLRVWQNAAGYSVASGRPMTWMITIARNRAIDVVRQRRDSVASQDSEGRDLLDAVPDPQDEGAAFEAADRLRLCLDRLDPAHRDCFLDAYHQGYSREELAIRYDRPVNTIKTWLHRSAGALRTCLGDR